MKWNFCPDVRHSWLGWAKESHSSNWQIRGIGYVRPHKPVRIKCLNVPWLIFVIHKVRCSQSQTADQNFSLLSKKMVDATKTRKVKTDHLLRVDDHDFTMRPAFAGRQFSEIINIANVVLLVCPIPLWHICCRDVFIIQARIIMDNHIFYQRQGLLKTFYLINPKK